MTKIPIMKTIRETASTGILPEHAIRRLVKDKKIAYITVGKSKVLVNFSALCEQLQKPDNIEAAE
jgi:hypothetical protein